jgi:hypothetical protein
LAAWVNSVSAQPADYLAAPSALAEQAEPNSDLLNTVTIALSMLRPVVLARSA